MSIKFDPSKLSEVIKNLPPQVTLTTHGRIKILRALRGEFGRDYVNNQKALDALNDFDEQRKDARYALKMRRILNGS